MHGLWIGFPRTFLAAYFKGTLPLRLRWLGACISMDRVAKLAAQKAVVIFSVSSCCMCHSVQRLFCDLGVSPAVHELDEDPRGREMERALEKLVGRSAPAPVVFVGGELVGSTDRIMALHLGGKLKPLLREAGALWL